MNLPILIDVLVLAHVAMGLLGYAARRRHDNGALKRALERAARRTSGEIA